MITYKVEVENLEYRFIKTKAIKNENKSLQTYKIINGQLCFCFQIMFVKPWNVWSANRLIYLILWIFAVYLLQRRQQVKYLLSYYTNCYLYYIVNSYVKNKLLKPFCIIRMHIIQIGGWKYVKSNVNPKHLLSWMTYNQSIYFVISIN